MKHLTLLLGCIVTVCTQVKVLAQPLVNTDVVLMVRNLPAPPANLQEAYARVFPNNATYPETRQFYQPDFQKIEQAYQEGQQLLQAFYLKNPTGMVAPAQTAPANRVSAQQQNAMDAATAELAQKMMSDPAFAQQFARMSEQEQQAYITKTLSDKGIKPVAGKPNTDQRTMPGMDIDWMTLCQDYASASTNLTPWTQLSALQQKYAGEHAAINSQTDAEIKQLPMISFGEYGHDHDPEKVKAIRKKGMEKHRKTADAMMKELNLLFAQTREEAQKNMAPLQNALQRVQYGKNYDFRMHYPLVLQTQCQMIAAASTLLENEIKAMEEVAQWEKEARQE